MIIVSDGGPTVHQIPMLSCYCQGGGGAGQPPKNFIRHCIQQSLRLGIDCCEVFGFFKIPNPDYGEKNFVEDFRKIQLMGGLHVSR